MPTFRSALLVLCSAVLIAFPLAIEVIAAPADEIADYITTTYLSGENPNDPLAPYVYVRGTPLAGGDRLVFGDFSNQYEYYASEGQYLAWVDSVAGARFEHPSRILIATVVGSVVTEEYWFATDMPVVLNDSSYWSGVLAPGGPDHYFPDSTYLDLTDPDTSEVGGWQSSTKYADNAASPILRFTNSNNASAIRIYGNEEEDNANDTKEEIDDTFDKMGIPAGNRGKLSYRTRETPSGNDLTDQIKAGIAAAGDKGAGPEMVIVVSAHGYRGGFNLDKNTPGHRISYDDFLCMVCEALKHTNKDRVLIIFGCCYSGSAVTALNNLNCPDCSGFEIGVSTACRSNEKGYTSRCWGHAWDFEEELEDENWCEKDMMAEGEENTDNVKDDLESADRQHPQWAKRTFTYRSAGGSSPPGAAPESHSLLPGEAVEADMEQIAALDPNRPNPFTTQTQIMFDLVAACMVRLEVYDTLGRKVATLVGGYREAGGHVAVWDGRDDDGRLVPSGVYFYRLQAGRASAMRKLVRVN